MGFAASITLMALADWIDRVLTHERRENLDRAVAVLKIDVALALRNILRQKRRSAFGLSAIVAGVSALMLAAGFFEFNYDSMREGVIRSRLGHLQVVKTGYFRSGASDPFLYIIPETSEDRKLLEVAPYVTTVTARIAFSGLISVGDATVAFLAEGVDPRHEKEASKFAPVLEGHDLSASSAKEVILGRGLAANLGAKIGSNVVLLVHPSTGGVNAVELKVTGFFVSSSKAFDDYALRIPLRTAQDLLRTNGVHSWLVLLDKTDKTTAVVDKVRPKLVDRTLELVPWYDAPMADFYSKTVELFTRQVGVLRFLVGAIIVLCIWNTMASNVRERIGEIGTCMALGDTRRTILRRFIVEGIALGVIGGLLGVLVGFSLSVVISHVGIPMPPPPGMTIGYTARIFLTFGIVVDAMILASVTAFLSALFPAWKASRMVITDAIRHGR